jgi:hypothetical protein
MARHWDLWLEVASDPSLEAVQQGILEALVSAVGVPLVLEWVLLWVVSLEKASKVLRKEWY